MKTEQDLGDSILVRFFRPTRYKHIVFNSDSTVAHFEVIKIILIKNNTFLEHVFEAKSFKHKPL